MTDENNVQETRRGGDPIDWAIVGAIAGGLAVIASIKQIMQARQLAESAEAEKQAVAGNLLRLRSMRESLEYLRFFVAEMGAGYEILIDESDEGITRSSIVFANPGQAEDFNNRFESALFKISQLARWVTGLDPIGLPLTKEDVDEYVHFPIRDINELTQSVMRTDLHPYERLEFARELIFRYRQLIGDLEVVLGKQAQS